jgi:predicted aspartyl protease
MKISILILSVLIALPVYAEPNTTAVPIHTKGTSTFYLKGQLGNLASADFMVDTGSGYLVINQESLAQLKASGQAEYIKDIRGRMANGQTLLVPVWRIAKLTINKQCILRDVEAAIFPGKTRQILGLSALTKAAPFSLSFDPPQILLSNCAQAS